MVSSCTVLGALEEQEGERKREMDRERERERQKQQKIRLKETKAVKTGRNTQEKDSRHSRTKRTISIFV